jgi:hypothetical protein
MHRLQRLGDGGRDHGAHPGLHEGAVEREVDLGEPRRGREAPLVLRSLPPSARMSSSVRGSHRITQSPVTRSGLSRLAARLQDRLVEPGRQDVDEVDVGGELVVLLPRDAGRDEDAEMPDRLVHRVDDGLPVARISSTLS